MKFRDYIIDGVSPYSKKTIKAGSKPGGMIKTKVTKCGKEVSYRHQPASGESRGMVCQDCAKKEPPEYEITYKEKDGKSRIKIIKAENEKEAEEKSKKSGIVVTNVSKVKK